MLKAHIAKWVCCGRDFPASRFERRTVGSVNCKLSTVS